MFCLAVFCDTETTKYCDMYHNMSQSGIVTIKCLNLSLFFCSNFRCDLNDQHKSLHFIGRDVEPLTMRVDSNAFSHRFSPLCEQSAKVTAEVDDVNGCVCQICCHSGAFDKGITMATNCNVLFNFAIAFVFLNPK